jgi:ATP-dependent helicase/nuclease subunit B
MAAASPSVFTIPPGVPFARSLAKGVLAEQRSDPLQLADALILVPTRRAVRALKESFAAALGGSGLLPRIEALGDVDEGDVPYDPVRDVAQRPTISSVRRLLLLARLVRQWGQGRSSPAPFAQALIHAKELARFLDETITHGVDFKELENLAPELYAAHWNDVIEFLRIVGENWPTVLEDEGAIEPVAARDANLRALAATLAAHPPTSPVIAAGSTGSIPATAELLKTIAQLPHGKVVLPGLDADLDETSWDALEAGHAQFGLKQLLQHLGVAREDVQLWPHAPETDAGRRSRVHFLAEALRPPPTTDAWRNLIEHSSSEFANALDNFALIEAANPREEALVVAIALREMLEENGQTAALVTPDRSLARRVASELARWNVAIDDSAGQPLSKTPPGAFLALLARAAAENFAPVALLALLKHPLAAAGEERADFLRHVRALESSALRGLKPDPGCEGIARRLEAREKTPDWLKGWFAKLTRVLEPLGKAARECTNVAELARAHVEVAEALAATKTEKGAARLWRGAAGEAAASLIDELMREGTDIEPGDFGQYSELFASLADMRAVRPTYNRHPRLAILGPLEARLLDFDLVVLSGLNEGGWPAEAATDPWLSRPMRAQLGLEPPERRTGLAAHDFSSLAAAKNVLLTRSLKENGTPTIPSRWLLRIKQLAKGLGLDEKLAARDTLLDWARALDAGKREPRCVRPAPRPPVDARPRELPITQIETWLRDPYAIYARYVLRLKPLDPIEAEPGPPERGTAVHRALEQFLKAYPDTLPPDAMDELVRMGDEAFAAAGASAAVLALWRPRYIRAAQWFLKYEAARRRQIAHSVVEVQGAIQIPAEPPFKLKGRADRIDIFRDGSAAIIDYKTGRAPTTAQIDKLLSPQLPLEAAMLLERGFGELSVEKIHELVHVRLAGGVPAGEECIAGVDAQAKALEAYEKLTRRVARYDNAAQPYVSRAMPFRMTDESDYDHLSRMQEWTREEPEQP